MRYNTVKNISNLNTLTIYTIKETDSDYALIYLEGGEKFCYIRFVFFGTSNSFYIILKKFKNENNQN